MNREQFIAEVARLHEHHLERKEGVTDEELEASIEEVADNIASTGVGYGQALAAFKLVALAGGYADIGILLD